MPAPVGVDGLAVVYLYVSDVARSAAWYREVLGVDLALDERDPSWAEKRFADGVRFALHKTNEGQRPTPGTIGVDFRIADIDVAIERLRAHGIEPEEVAREPYGSFCVVRDPDGYPIHLFQSA